MTIQNFPACIQKWIAGSHNKYSVQSRSHSDNNLFFECKIISIHKPLCVHRLTPSDQNSFSACRKPKLILVNFWHTWSILGHNQVLNAPEIRFSFFLSISFGPKFLWSNVMYVNLHNVNLSNWLILLLRLFLSDN